MSRGLGDVYKRQVVNNQRYDWLTENIPVYTLGVVKVSTGVLKLVKLSAGKRQNPNLNINANDTELAYAA